MSGNYTDFSVDPISSVIQQCQSIELLEKQALIKAFRASIGQIKTQADTSNNTSTFAVEPEYSFSVSGGQKYLLVGALSFLIGGAAGPLGGLKVQFNAPANSTYTLNGIISTTQSATASALTGWGNGSGSPVAGDVAGLNASLTLAAAGTSNIFAEVTFQGLFIPTVDDLLTFSFAQVSAAASNPTILLRGSTFNAIALSNSRRAPNTI